MTERQPVTDAMLRAALTAMVPDRIQGFSTQIRAGEWGKPHYIRDVSRPSGEQEIWRGDSYADMVERLEMERLRLGFEAAFTAHGEQGDKK